MLNQVNNSGTALGKIIILNGASSSGKTTILHALQNKLREPYLNVGIDKFIWMLPKRYLDRPLWDDVLGLATQAGVLGHQLFSSMHKTIALLSRQGMNVVADHVLVEPEWLRECAELFAPLPAYFIGVMCPLPILLERERLRKDRTLGQAEAQFPLMHKHGIYDLEVDTSIQSVTQCVQAIKERLESQTPPTAFRQIYQDLK